MEAEDLIPRLLLLGGLTAAIILYTRRRQSRVQEVTATATSAASNAAAQAADTATSVVGRSQHLLESVLDNVADQALKELKVVLKDGVKRLEHLVDEL